MVRGGALFYALAVSLMVGLISSSLIFFAYYNRVEFEQLSAINRAQRNAQSGLNLITTHPETVSYESETEVDLYDELRDFVKLKKKHWGAFEIGVSTAKAGNYSFSRAAMIGANLHDDSKISLYLADQNKPLSLCGKTLIRGRVFLPEAGVKRAYIEGQSFIGSKLIDGEVKKSTKSLPPINTKMIAHNQNYLGGNFGNADSTVSFEQIAKQDTISNSFTRKTAAVFSSDPIALTHQFLSGNVCIYSGTSIFIGAGAEVDDIIFYAPVIIIEQGFKGSLQAFASDSLVVGKECTLNYPSVLGLIKDGREGNASLTVRENSEVKGVVFAYREKTNPKEQMKALLEKGVTIHGQVYTNGSVDLKGSIFGSIACKKFLLNTPSSVYENHLLNVTIDYSRLSPHFAGVNLIHDAETRKIVKWLY